MCGICGEITFQSSCDPKRTYDMTRALGARGPNGHGIFAREGFALGHTRLSILDLSTKSNQPMVDTELGIAVSFNGCIYNFRELRQELMGLGFRFFSDGDTEVIAKSYRAWGIECAQRFKGMFAIAFAELDTGRLILVRDRLGIKPLYYSATPDGLRFASTLPALLASGSIDTSINPCALHHYLSFHAVIPAPLTILNGVNKLPPATIMCIEANGRRTEHRYWQLKVAEQAEPRRPAAEWRDEFAELMRAAVQRRTVSNVPIGVLLSGGLDSSLLVGLFAEHGGDVETFSIGFDAVNGVQGDEFAYSDLIARHFETRHHKIKVSANELTLALPSAIEAMAEPMVSHDNVAFYLLSREVSRHVKVVQCGQGADEVFGGYHWHRRMLRSNNGAHDYAESYFEHRHHEIREMLCEALPDYSGDFIEEYFDKVGGRPIDATLQIDTEVMLPDDPVKRLDNMSMAFGLEARVPFLDHELVEFAAKAPLDIKMGESGKSALKDVARSIVPSDVIDRPKGYFPVPALKFLEGGTLEFIRGILTSEKARKRGLFKTGYIDRLLADPSQHLTGKGNSKLWQIGLLEGWLQAHGI